MRIRLPKAPIVLGSIVAGSGASLAAEPLFSPEPIAPAGWIVTLKANAVVAPSFPGSRDYSVFGFPSLSLRRAGTPKVFSAPDDGFGFAVQATEGFRVGVVGRYRGGRYLDNDRRLFGFKDVKWAVEPGVFVEYWPLEAVRLRAEVRRGFHGHDGFVADLGVDLVHRFGPFTFSAGPRRARGASEFTRTYFGVKPWEAAINRRVLPYRPSGGVTSVGIASALSYDWSEQWTTTVHASYGRLVADAADSPIVKRFGSENQFSVGAILSYSFAVSP